MTENEPASVGARSSGADPEQIERFKDYLADPRQKIKLDDLVAANVRAALCDTADDKPPFCAPIANGQDVADRLNAYESAMRPLVTNAVLLGKWATDEQRPTLASMVARMADNCAKPLGGNTVQLGMRWYPLSLLTYASGVAAVAADNYDALAAAHTKRIEVPMRARGESPAVLVAVTEGMMEMNAWGHIPGNNRTYSPESDYMLKTLRPLLEELLFLGGGFEQAFDFYEILRALMYSDLTDGRWCQVGRFGTKHVHRRGDSSPYMALRVEADQQRDKWGPLMAGLFRGSYARFEQVAKKFETEVLSKLQRF